MTKLIVALLGLASTCGCDPDCPLQDGKTYEMLIVERYDESTSFEYQSVTSPFCNLDDFRADDRYAVLATVGTGEDACAASFELQGTPTGLASLEKSGILHVATTPEGCTGRWSIRISGEDPRRASTAGQQPEALLHREFQPTMGCDAIEVPCLDRFVIQLF